MPAKSRQSILKRQRELKRLEKAALKRERREERRRRAAEVRNPDENGEDPGESVGDEVISSEDQPRDPS